MVVTSNTTTTREERGREGRGSEERGRECMATPVTPVTSRSVCNLLTLFTRQGNLSQCLSPCQSTLHTLESRLRVFTTLDSRFTPRVYSTVQCTVYTITLDSTL